MAEDIRPQVVIEVLRNPGRIYDAEDWLPLEPPITDRSNPGSFSATNSRGEAILYVFGWVDGTGPGVWRTDRLWLSAQEIALTEDLTAVAELRPGLPYRIRIDHPDGGRMDVRLTHRLPTPLESF